MFAISDDDFSRLVIAQQFAAHPQIDPSGTSWLPLPFWLYGTLFALFGNSLEVARVAAIVIGLLGVVGVYVAARWLGMTKPAAALGCLVAAVFPHAANYRLATVPDYPTAVLTLLAAASLGSRERRIRVLGALAAMSATLSRYETWPVALAVSLFACVDYCQERRNHWLVAAAVTAPAGILAWLLHGQVRHHDVFFFVKRVTAYKRALGGVHVSWWTRAWSQPLSLIREEPELVTTALLLAVLVTVVVGKQVWQAQTWRRPVLALSSLLAFLILGEMRDGTPTHHGERVLLSLWLGIALQVAALGATFASHLGRSKPRRWAAFGALVAGGLLVAVTAQFVRPESVTVEPFVDRHRELAVGEALRRLVPQGERVALYTDDYGYFAVTAAFGRPEGAYPLLSRDPRHPESDPTGSPAALSARLETLGARYLVVPASHRPEADRIATRLESWPGFDLYRRN